MREVRRDPLTGVQVVLSTERPLITPSASGAGALPEDRQCPFCPGHEAATHATIAEICEDGVWVARAFANRTPALRVEEPLQRTGHGPYDRTSGTGAHEVIVECPEHLALHEAPPARVASALRLARDRLADLERDTRLAHLVWYRNHGCAAGASVGHAHAQVLGLPEVPARTLAMRSRVELHLQQRGRPLLQDVIDVEREAGTRMVWEGERLALLSPWAPEVPFSLWIVPTRAGPAFRAADDDWIEEAATAMRVALTGLGRVLGRHAYNAVLHDTPQGRSSGVHWPHLRILPRLAGQGGFELGWGSGMHGMPPDEAARLLRS